MGLLDSLFPSAEADPLTQTSPADMQTLALGKALEQIQQTGRQRTAGPMGSIAQNLMPLFGAMVQAKAAQAQAVQSAQQDRLNQLLTLAKIGELGRQGGGEGPKTAEQGAVQAQLRGEPTDPWTQLQGQLHPQKPEKPDLSENRAVYDALTQQNKGIPPTPGQFAGALQDRKVQAQEAGMGPRLELFKEQEQFKATQRAGEKKDLDPTDYTSYANMASGLDTLDDVMKSLSGKGAPTRMGAAITSLSGGLISNELWGKYATFYNDVAYKRFKSRVTGAEMARLKQELPDPMSYALDPKGFQKRLAVAADHAKDIFEKEISYTDTSYKMPPDLIAKRDILRVQKAMELAAKNAKGNPAGAPAMSFAGKDASQLEADFTKLRAKFPKMTPTELAIYYQQYGAP